MSYPDDRGTPKVPFVGEGFRVEPDFLVEPDYRHESGASVYDPTTVPIAGSGFGSSAEATRGDDEQAPSSTPGGKMTTVAIHACASWEMIFAGARAKTTIVAARETRNAID